MSLRLFTDFSNRRQLIYELCFALHCSQLPRQMSLFFSSFNCLLSSLGSNLACDIAHLVRLGFALASDIIEACHFEYFHKGFDLARFGGDYGLVIVLSLLDEMEKRICNASEKLLDLVVLAVLALLGQEAAQDNSLFKNFKLCLIGNYYLKIVHSYEDFSKYIFQKD